ncbi:MAG TPA: dTDP-4-dehydrorhamnose reductase [Candidatus Hydrogenedentes bacterium]|nr:dTDP-4-dehydrorhamnose reductase [Candidatus Hydrogenedentota bacterium]HNT89048.1 dTDP-4-dehydrorhamnose reductase [Candidatus Hydrogenedentota bacterium]
MRTLVFGAKGQLGRDLLDVFDREGEVLGHDLPEVNIAYEPHVQAAVAAFGPDLIVNAAAYTDVDGAEDNLETAFLTNEVGARNLAEIAEYYHIPMVHISTDYVFDGSKKTPYEPEDSISPLGVYGKTKAAGEAAVRKANPRHFIVRTAWLYGPGGNNFVEKILRLAKKGGPLRVVCDEEGSPTHTLDLAEAVLALARTDAFGVYHAVNDGACSRFELAREILDRAGIGVRLEACVANDFPTKARRPAYSVLSNAKIERATGHTMRSWEAALADYMIRRTASS